MSDHIIKYDDTHDFRQRYCSLDLVFFANIFMPKTRIIKNRVILISPGMWDENDEAVLEQLSNKIIENDLKYIDSFNWVELYHELGAWYESHPLLALNTDERDLDEEIARMIARSWDAWLHHCYPDRKFETFAIHPDETGDVWGVGFREIR